MALPNVVYTVDLNAPLSPLSGSISAGQVAIQVGATFMIATSANRASAQAGAIVLVALSPASPATTQQFLGLQIGAVPPNILGLGAGSVSAVGIDANGNAIRVANGNATAFGRCDALGNVTMTPWAIAGNGIAPAGTGVVHVTGGVFDAAADLGTGNQVLTTNPGATDRLWSTIGGDVIGTIAALVVAAVHGATVPAAGALTTGNVLQVSGPSALSYAPVNLAGGANYVTGTLPAANQAAQTMGGDVSGTTAAATVVGLQGRSVSSSAPATGNTLGWSGTAWAPNALNLAGGSNYVTGTLPAGNLPNLAGDVTGPVTATVVGAISGTGVNVDAANGFNFPTSGKLRFANYGSAQTLLMARTAGTVNAPIISTNATALTIGDSSAWNVVILGSGTLNIEAGTAIECDTAEFRVSSFGGTRNWSLLTGATNCSAVFDAAMTAPVIGQTQTAGSSPASLTIAPQTSSNGTTVNASSLIVNIQSPVGAGTQGFFRAQQGGNDRAWLGQFSGAIGGLWLGSGVPSTTNYAVNGDGTAQTAVNGPSGGSVLVTIANGTQVTVTSSNALLGPGSSYNVSMFAAAGSYGGGLGVLFLGSANTAPTSNPAGGGIVYEASNSLKHRSVNGAIWTAAGDVSGSVTTQSNTIDNQLFDLQTSATTATTIATIAVPASKAIRVFVKCDGRLHAAAFTGQFVAGVCIVSNNGGTLSIAGSTTFWGIPSGGPPTLSFTTSGTNLLVQIASNTATATDWQAEIEIATI